MVDEPQEDPILKTPDVVASEDETGVKASLNGEGIDPYSVESDLTSLPKASKIATKAKMPAELEGMVKQLSPMQRKYLELRARGLKQTDAAKKAGSTAKGRDALGRIGYGIEQLPGAKDYIFWLQEQRARVALVDEIEIIQMIRQVFREAMMNNKFSDANKAAELLGLSIGLFSKGGNSTKQQVQNAKDVIDTNKESKKLEAFKDVDDSDPSPTSNQSEVRQAQIQKLLRDLNKSKL